MAFGIFKRAKKEEPSAYEAKAEEILAKAQEEALKIRKGVEEKASEVEIQHQRLEEEKKEVDELKSQLRARLEAVSSLSQEEAKEELLKRLDEELVEEKARRIKEAEGATQAEAEKKAREILLSTLPRVYSEHMAELTTSTVKLPDEEMKGRIIGKEGRNIKAFEVQTGVNVIVDETPQIITVSSYDPIRREIAKIAMEKLVADGRIQPARIEEVVRRVKEEIKSTIQEAGEELAYKVGVTSLPPEIIALLGRFKYRTSYGQNLAEHTLEVVSIGKLLAQELGADVELVKKACLLHDLGKVVSSELEGPHAKVGADLARRCGVSEEVVKTFEGHHTEEFPNLEAVIIYLADAISGARPGARYEDYEAYIKRIKELEEVANSFLGVEEAYAIAAGREVRVIVKPEEVPESEMVNLAHDISYKIHQQIQNFPGQIKVTVIRETRASDVAKPRVL